LDDAGEFVEALINWLIFPDKNRHPSRDGYYLGKAWFAHCIFNDSRGLEKYQAANSIGFTGAVAGLRRYTLIIKDC
jgi:hypothetical protein